MREIADHLARWHAAGEPFAVAVVTAVSGSAPRPPGAALAVRADGAVAGSVSGGCVEGAVCQLAEEVLVSGEPVRQRFGYSADDAFAVGLTCGGEVEVFVRRVDPARDTALAAAVDAVRAGEPVALATVLDSPREACQEPGRAAWEGPPGAAVGRSVAVAPDRVVGSTGHARLDAAVAEEARSMLERGLTGQRWHGSDARARRTPAPDATTVFVQTYAEPPRMLVFGAIDFAAAVSRIGTFLGYRVTVCDARPAFATRERFPDADEVVVDWPHRYLAGTTTDARTAVCVLTHDPRFDVPLLVEALRRPLGYVGAMGSRRTHRGRVAKLREAGLTAAELSRLRSPIGLDLGAFTPEETAVSIAAEIVATRSGATTRALSATDGPIHGDRVGAAEPTRTRRPAGSPEKGVPCL